PSSLNFETEVPISFGLKCVRIISVISYLIVPSLLTCRLYLALNILTLFALNNFSWATSLGDFFLTKFGNSLFCGKTFRAFGFRIHMDFTCVFVRVLRCRFGRGSFCLRLVFGFRLWSEDPPASVHARGLVDTMREAEIPAFRILDYIHGAKRMMRPAIAGMAAGMAHAN
ncbi:MAG: hypothetical protein UY97_C0025G0001, partial [Parcubacteria group bacterium GW2011_GWB1_57_6]